MIWRLARPARSFAAALVLVSAAIWACGGSSSDGGNDGGTSDAKADAPVDAGCGAACDDASFFDAGRETGVDAQPFDAGRDPSCPSTFNAVEGGCPKPNATCTYFEGTCGCELSCGPPPDPDASATWMCTTRGTGCPIAKPVAQSACSTSMTCTYGVCCTESFSCQNGRWTSGGVICPP